MAEATKNENGWEQAERLRGGDKRFAKPVVSPAIQAANVTPSVPAPAVASAGAAALAAAAPIPVPAPNPAPAPAPAPKPTLAQRIKAALEKAEGATEAEIEKILGGE